MRGVGFEREASVGFGVGAEAGVVDAAQFIAAVKVGGGGEDVAVGGGGGPDDHLGGLTGGGELGGLRCSGEGEDLALERQLSSFLVVDLRHRASR